MAMPDTNLVDGLMTFFTICYWAIIVCAVIALILGIIYVWMLCTDYGGVRHENRGH